MTRHGAKTVAHDPGHWQRNVVSLTVLSLLLVVLLALSSTALASRQVTGDVKGQLSSTASVSSDVVSQKMSDLVALVDSDATRSSLADDLAAGSKGNANVETLLGSLTRAFPGISASFIASLKGTSLATYPLEPSVLGTNFAYREWYKGLVSTGKTYISDAIVTKEIGNPEAVTVTAYIKGSNGQPVGILGVNYGLEAIKTFAGNVGRAQGITLILTDRTGTSLTSGGAGGLHSIANDPRVHAALEGHTGTVEYTPVLSDGRRGPAEMSSYAPIAGTGWAVVASVRESVAYASLNRLRATVLAIAGAIVVILLLVGFMIARSVRRRRDVELEFQRRDREMGQVLESIDEAFVSISAGGEITAWNGHAQTLYGWTASEVLGKNLAEMVIGPDFRETFKNDLAQHRAGLTSTVVGKRVEITAIHRDGREIPVELCVWAKVDDDGFSAFMHDITARLAAQAELASARELAGQFDVALASGRVSASLLASIVDSSVDAIIGKTLDGTITTWNRGAERMFGYGATEVIGQNISLLYPPVLLHELAHNLSRTKDGVLVEEHYTQRMCKDGTLLDVAITIAPIRDAAGSITGASGIAHDITDRLTLERERRGLEDRLNQSERLESIGRLAGGIAHDFNNLLAVILNYATFVSEELDDTEAARADIGHIQAAAQRASALTKQLLAFARKEVMQPKVLDVNEVVTGVEEILRRTIGEHVAMEVALAPDLWPVEADPGRLGQVLMNLVINARDAMPRGGTLTITTRNVELEDETSPPESVLKPGRYVSLRIDDTGNGMDPDVLEHVFEPFFTTKAQGDGTGLGLPMVFGIVRQAGGDIRLSSEVGVGTVCEVFLPVTERLTTRDMEVVERPPKNHGCETILVVEDEDALREVARRILTRSGYEVLASASGPEAIAMVKKFDGTIDLLLSDVIMPIMAGSEVALRVRALVPGLPVLFMSGYAQPVLGSTLSDGQALLAKPFSEQELLVEIRKLLDASVTVRV
ncbi:MAG: PAS domain S-box protein [Acidimicrobiales bacterium]